MERVERFEKVLAPVRWFVGKGQDANHTNDGTHGALGMYSRVFLRFMQFVLGLTVAGLYGTDLDAARKHGAQADPKWAYAVTVAGLSCVTAIVYAVPKVRSWFFFSWDSVLFLCWLVVFGIFGKMYIPEDAEGNKGIERMKNAVWVDLVNMLMWLISAAYGAFLFFNNRKLTDRKRDLEG